MQAKKKKNTIKDELEALSKYVTGEMALEQKQQKLAELKKKAVERQKNVLRKKVTSREMVLEKEQEENDQKKNPVPEKVVQNITVFSWTAPIRMRFFFEMKVFVGIVVLCLAFVLYLAILNKFELMAVIFALLFFIYVSGTVAPVNVENKITTRGIDSIDKLYEWYALEDFWFTKKNGQDLLFVTTKLRLPSKLILLLDSKDRESIFMLLQDKLLYKDIRKQSGYDKLVFGEYVPLKEI